MNQVQVRQVPLSASTSPERMSGSWFSTGYHGHFRAKPRIDACHSFRQLARPTPPRTFSDRQMSAATTHMFSDHDNRRRYEGDPLIRGAQKNIGKRKSTARVCGKFDPFLISWLPKNADRKTYIDETRTSSYTDDFNPETALSPLSFDAPPAKPAAPSEPPLPNILAMDANPATESSLYSLVYSHGQPDAERARQIRQETFQRYAGTELRRQQIRRIDQSPNVAACLSWTSNKGENPPTNTIDKLININLPVTLPPRISSSIDTTMNRKNAYRSESMPTFKNVEQAPRFDPTTLRECYNVKVIPSLRRSTSFVDTTNTNPMDSLIAKYM